MERNWRPLTSVVVGDFLLQVGAGATVDPLRDDVLLRQRFVGGVCDCVHFQHRDVPFPVPINSI